MDDNKNAFTLLNTSGERGQPIALIALLLQNIGNMQDINEVFLWLSKAITQSFNIAIVQFWATRMDATGQFHAKIEAFAGQNPSIPQPLHVNQHVMAVIERLFYEQQNTASLSVETIFAPLQAILFTRNNLPYWTGYFLPSNIPLSSGRAAFEPGKISPLSTTIVSLFTKTPLSIDQSRAINFTLKQAMRIIISHNFLRPDTQDTAKVARQNLNQKSTFSAIIPRRLQNIEQSQASNPFANASIIANRNARRLFSLIDGHKNVVELTQVTHLEQKELIEALRYLVQQQRIEFYTRDGERMQQVPLITPAS
jgi:hypothetical protein